MVVKVRYLFSNNYNKLLLRVTFLAVNWVIKCSLTALDSSSYLKKKTNRDVNK